MTPSDFPSLLQASPPSRRTAPSIPTAALSTASVVSSRRSSAGSSKGNVAGLGRLVPWLKSGRIHHKTWGFH